MRTDWSIVGILAAFCSYPGNGGHCPNSCRVVIYFALVYIV
jgi:hypothetical protein